MTKSVGYICVSTQGQFWGGYSLAYRRGEIMRYCTDNGIELEGLQSMLADRASVNVDCVVALDTLRL